jgi:predicted nicotinamide N-methyase
VTAAARPLRTELRFGDIGLSMYRVADLAAHVDAERLLAAGEVEEPPYWMHLWPGARALAGRLAEESSLAGARVLEIGCGLGLPALVAAARGAAVVASDRRAEPLAMLARSAALNGLSIDLLQMDWGDMALACDFDLLLGADVAYDAGAEEALAAACAAHVGCGGRLLLADSVNTYRTGLAARLGGAGLPVRESRREQREDGAVVWVRLLEGVRA